MSCFLFFPSKLCLRWVLWISGLKINFKCHIREPKNLNSQSVFPIRSHTLHCTIYSVRQRKHLNIYIYMISNLFKTKIIFGNLSKKQEAWYRALKRNTNPRPAGQLNDLSICSKASAPIRNPSSSVSRLSLWSYQMLQMRIETDSLCFPNLFYFSKSFMNNRLLR